MRCSCVLLVCRALARKAALAALSTFKPAELISAIQSEDVKAVSTIPAWARKPRSALILELKGNLAQAGEQDLFSAATAAATERLQGARDGLLAMGFTLAEADLALKGAPEELNTEGALLQYARKRLGSVG